MQWLGLLRHSKRLLGWSLHALAVSVGVLSRSSGFLPHSKDRHSGDAQTGHLKSALVGMWVWMVVCPCISALWGADDLTRVCCPKAAGTGSTHLWTLPSPPSSHARNRSMHQEIKMQATHVVQGQQTWSHSTPNRNWWTGRCWTALKWDCVLYYWQLFPQVVLLLCLMLTVLNQSQKDCCNLFMHEKVNVNWVNSSINLFPLHCLPHHPLLLSSLWDSGKTSGSEGMHFSSGTMEALFGGWKEY